MQVKHLEEAREAVAQHLPRKEPIENQQDDPPCHERERNAGAPEWGGERLKQQGGALDRGPEEDVGHRAEDADPRREGDGPDADDLAAKRLADRGLSHRERVSATRAPVFRGRWWNADTSAVRFTYCRVRRCSRLRHAGIGSAEWS